MLSLALLFLPLVASVHAAVLTLQSPRVAISTPDGSTLRSEPLSLTQKVSTPLDLNHDEILKITFQLLDKDSGKGVQPHQTFLRFYDPQSREEGVQPIRVSADGKAKFTLNMAKPPVSLPPTTTAPLQVSLIIGASTYSPVKHEIFDLHVPASRPPPVHPDEPSFHVLQELHHTFRPAQRVPPKVVSAFFTILVGLPWVALLGMWATVFPRISHSRSPSVLPFIATLGALEVLLFWYWIDLRLGQVLLYGATLGLVNIFTGRYALERIATERLSGK